MKEDKPVYEDITDFKKLKSFMEASLEDYNNEPGYIAMDLVLFRDAIEHGTYQLNTPHPCIVSSSIHSSYSDCEGHSTAEREYAVSRDRW